MTELESLMASMPARHASFVDQYCIDRNGTQAAIRTGYSERSAHVTASRLLKNVNVARAIELRSQAISEKAGVDAAYVIAGLKELVERCMQHKPVMEWNYEERRLEQARDENGQGVYQFDSMGANRALENLGRHLGLFTDRMKVEDDSTLAMLRSRLGVNAG